MTNKKWLESLPDYEFVHTLLDVCDDLMFSEDDQIERIQRFVRWLRKEHIQ